jgi:hypothetical protein
MLRQERRRELQLTQRLAVVKAVLAVRLPRHPSIGLFCTLLFS